MKKFYSLLCLLLAFVGGVSTAWAQHFLVSDAPSNGQWAEKTYWYYIKNSSNNGWLSTATEYVDANGLRLDKTAQPSDDAGKWCVVGNESDGYRFYNKATGTEKVMGITMNSQDTYGKSYASMTDYTSDSQNSTEDGGVGILFGRKDDALILYDLFYLSGVEGNDQFFLNYRGPYLAYWHIDYGSAKGDGGCKFDLVATEEFDNLLYFSKNMVEGHASHNGAYGWLTDAGYTEMSGVYNTYKDKSGNSLTEEQKVSAIASLKSALAKVNKPSYGTKVLMQNMRYGDYVKVNGTQMNGVNAVKSYTGIFTLKQGEAEGSYKIYSEYLQKYVGSIPGTSKAFTFVDEAEAGSYNLNGMVCGYFYISDANSSEKTYNVFHMESWNHNIVCWNADAEASYFMLTDVASDLAATIDANVKSKVNYHNCVGYRKSSQSEISAYTAYANADVSGKPAAEKALDDAVAANTSTDKVELNTGKYYVIGSAVFDDKYVVEDYGNFRNNSNKLYSKSYGNNLVPALWQFEESDKEGYFHIKAANSSKYARLTTWNDGTSYMVDKGDNYIGYYKIYNSADDGNYVKTNYAVNLRCLNYNGDASKISVDGTMHCGPNGTHTDTGEGEIMSWNATCDGNQFFISEVTSVPVSITAAKYATLHLPFAVNIPSNVRAFIGVKNDNDEIILKELTDVIPAKTPVILAGEEGKYEFTINYDDQTETPVNALSGTLVPYTIEDGVSAYVLKNGTKGMGLYKVTSTTDRTIGANKAYFKQNASGNEPASLSFSFDDVTGINQAAAGSEVDSVYYDLNGRRVLYPVHGIYVKGNGQKVYIK